MKAWILSGIYVVAAVYVLGQLQFWLRMACGGKGRGRKLRGLLAVIYVLVASMPLAGAWMKESDLQLRFQQFGNIWLGFLIYGGGALLLLHILRGLSRLFGAGGRRTLGAHEKETDEVSGGKRVLAVLLILALIAGTSALNIYGMKVAKDVQVTNYVVDVSGSNSEHGRLRIVHISDLHMGVNSDPEHMEEMVRKINEQDPDVVLATGDYFTSTYRGLRHPEKYLQALKKIKAPIYACYGNHDVVEPLLGGFSMADPSEALRPKTMEDFLQDAGFHLLSDQMIEIDDGKIQLIGRIDKAKSGDGKNDRAEVKDLFAGVDQDKPVIVLEHEPEDFSELARYGTDLVLSGHTHDGQIAPGNYITALLSENGYGIKTFEGMTSIVTSGVGYYGPPIRIGTISEVAVIDLNY